MNAYIGHDGRIQVVPAREGFGNVWLGAEQQAHAVGAFERFGQ